MLAHKQRARHPRRGSGCQARSYGRRPSFPAPPHSFAGLDINLPTPAYDPKTGGGHPRRPDRGVGLDDVYMAPADRSPQRVQFSARNRRHGRPACRPSADWQASPPGTILTTGRDSGCLPAVAL